MKKRWLLLFLVPIVSVLVIRLTQKPEPNDDFGLTDYNSYSLYSYYVTPVYNCEGDADLISVAAVHPGTSDGVYEHIMEHPEDEHAANGLTLGFGIHVADDHVFALTSEQYTKASLTKTDITYKCGGVERLDENGVWAPVGDLFSIKKPSVPFMRVYPGDSTMWVKFPIHEPGIYRISIPFREYTARGMEFSTGEKLHSVSFTLTVPDSTYKKYDLVSVDLGVPHYHEVSIAAVCRSNDGTIPYQDLSSIILEEYRLGKWERQSTNAVKNYYDYRVDKAWMVPAAYSVEQPFSDEKTSNLFVGTARVVIGHRNARYRITMEFCENSDGSGRRSVLRFDFYIPS